MSNSRRHELSHGRLIAALLVISFFLLMFGNGAVSLTHPDEVFYVQTVKEMLQHHTWMTPYLFDAPQFEKPILFFWLLAAAIQWMGLNSFAARFWPAAFGMIGIIVTYWMAFMLFNNKRAAFLSGVILATSFIYLTLARAVLTDMVFSIWVVMTIALFYWALSEPRFRNVGIFLGFIAMAAAVLTKGLLGIIFPVGVIGGYMIYKRDFSLMRLASFWVGVIIFLTLAAPWHLLMVKLYGHEFVKEYWWNVHVRRIIEAEHSKSNTWYFYLGTIFAGIFPWSFFLFPTMGFINKTFKENSFLRDQLVFLFLWMVVVLIVVQSAQSKLASYIFPIFPAMAIILGYYWTMVLEGSEIKAGRMTARIAYGLGVVLGLAAIVGPMIARKYPDLVISQEPIYVFSSLSFLCACAIWFFTRRQEYHKTFAAIASITAVILVFLLLGRTNAEPWISCQPIADAFKRIDHSDSTVLCSKFYARGVKFYTDRRVAVIDINGKGFFSPHPIPFLNTPTKVQDFLNTQDRTYAIVKMSAYKDLKKITAGHFILEELAKIGDIYLLSIKKIKS